MSEQVTKESKPKATVFGELRGNKWTITYDGKVSPQDQRFLRRSIKMGYRRYLKNSRTKKKEVANVAR